MLCTVPCILFALMQERSWLFVQFFTSQFRVYMLATFAGKSGPVSIPGCTVRSGIRMSSRSQSSNILLKINWERCSRSPRSLKGNGWFFGSRLTQTEFLTQIGEIILGHNREEDKYCRISSEQKEKQVRRRYFSCYMEQLISTTYLFICAGTRISCHTTTTECQWVPLTRSRETRTQGELWHLPSITMHLRLWN